MCVCVSVCARVGVFACVLEREMEIEKVKPVKVIQALMAFLSRLAHAVILEHILKYLSLTQFLIHLKRKEISYRLLWLLFGAQPGEGRGLEHGRVRGWDVGDADL